MATLQQLRRSRTWIAQLVRRCLVKGSRPAARSPRRQQTTFSTSTPTIQVHLPDEVLSMALVAMRPMRVFVPGLIRQLQRMAVRWVNE
jgi:hypothetical protein